MGLLVLVRHGESRWNQANRFQGWVDVSLSENGVREAEICAKHCVSYRFDCAFSSRLERAHQTLHTILAKQGRTSIVQHTGRSSHRPGWVKRSNLLRNDDLPVYMDDTLNERYYGDLQGMKKSEAEKKYGFEQVLRWRRGYSDRPPKGESLKQVFGRAVPYFTHAILPRVKRGEHVVVAAHGNSLRAIIKHIMGIDDEMIAHIDLPQAKPIVYRLSKGIWKHELGELRPGRPLR